MALAIAECLEISGPAAADLKRAVDRCTRRGWRLAISGGSWFFGVRAAAGTEQRRRGEHQRTQPRMDHRDTPHDRAPSPHRSLSIDGAPARRNLDLLLWDRALSRGGELRDFSGVAADSRDRAKAGIVSVPGASDSDPLRFCRG